MKKLVLTIIGLIALFSILRAYSEEQSRFTIHPSSIEYTDKDNEISIGFGLIDTVGDKTKTWEIFPVRILLKSGNTRFNLGMNGLSLITRSGINFENSMTVNSVHRGDLISFGGNVTINSTVEGNVWVFSADITLNPGAIIKGDVVAVGGHINQSGNVVIYGNKNAIPELAIPFIGLLSSTRSASTIHFIVEIFSMFLYLLVLFLLAVFRKQRISEHADGIFSQWKSALLYILLSAIIIPLLILLLVASIVGVVVIPLVFIALILIAYYGFLALIVRIGRLFIQKGNDTIPGLFLSGLVGLLVIKAPLLLGILLSLLSSEIISLIGTLLTYIGSSAIIIGFIYSFGAILSGLKERG